LKLIIFGLIWFLSKKIIKPKFFKKKTETGSNQPVLVQFGSVFRTKTSSNRFDSVFSGFGSVLARFFAGLAWVFFVLDSVQFFRF
jgi:hypothetical protein